MRGKLILGRDNRTQPWTFGGVTKQIKKFNYFLTLVCFLFISFIFNNLWKNSGPLSITLRGCLHDTGATVAPEQGHSVSLLRLYICLHDTTTKKCHPGASHPGVSSPRFLYRARISLRYEISQRYHVNAKRPAVSVRNRSAERLERVARA